MLLIVAHHYVVNSGLTAPDGPIFVNPLSAHSLFLLLFGAWGKIGINCFVLISGYYMCKSHITAKKFAKLLCEVMFYRIVINMIFGITGYASFSLQDIIKILIPITSIADGFTSAYLVFFLSIPFLNILVQHMNEKQHIRLLLLCGFTYIFLGTVPFFSVTMNYVSWYIVLFFISSYIRLYPKTLYTNTRFWGWMTLASVLLSAASVVSCAWIGMLINRNSAYGFVSDSNTFLAVLTGLSAFMFFKNLKLKYSKLINTIAASTFGVLCIHANSDTMRQWLWRDTLNNVGMYNSALMPVHAVGSVLGIFIICVAIDYLRIRFVETPIFKLWDKHVDNIRVQLNQAENQICKKLHIEI